jgi:hypothetical protein
MAALRW